MEISIGYIMNGQRRIRSEGKGRESVNLIGKEMGGGKLNDIKRLLEKEVDHMLFVARSIFSVALPGIPGNDIVHIIRPAAGQLCAVHTRFIQNKITGEDLAADEPGRNDHQGSKHKSDRREQTLSEGQTVPQQEKERNKRNQRDKLRTDRNA